MTRSTSTSVATVFAVAAAALMFASCGVEAVGPAEAKSQAELLAERFVETTQKAPSTAPVAEKTDPVAKVNIDAQQIAAKKKAEERARKAAAAANAAKSAEQLKADEAEMLAAARVEAEARRVEIETARATQEAADRVAETDAKLRADEQKVTELAAIAAQAKAVEAVKKAEELRVAEAKRLAEEKVIIEAKATHAARIKNAEEAAAKSAEQAHQMEQARLAEVKALEGKREIESKMLAESLRRAEAIREAKAVPKIEIPTPMAVGPSSVAERVVQGPMLAPQTAAQQTINAQNDQKIDLARAGDAARPIKLSPRVTILVIMEPGKKGIRRFDKAADPVLCVKEGCYVSAGTASAAELRPVVKVLGFSNTFGARAGACQHALGCTFRNVDLGSSAGFIQPVDMKVMVHDRREPQIITEDSDCRLEAQRLLCRRPVLAGSYRLWIIPEATAERAGSAALEAAVRDGLPTSQQAVLSK